MKLNFEYLPESQQLPYYEKARFLIEKGYIIGEDVRDLAKRIYYTETVDKPDK